MKAYLTPYNIYTFNYEMGLTQTNIDFVDVVNDAGVEIKVVALGAWKQTLHLQGSAVNQFDFDHTGFSINPTGAIEFMYHFQTAGAPAKEDLHIVLYDGATRLVQIIHDESAEAIGYDNGGGYTNIYSYPSVTWYIISIQVDINAGVNGQFSVYVYDASYTLLDSVEDVEFENNAGEVDKVRFYNSVDAAAEVQYWLDNIGITAEGSYTQGDIQYMLTDATSYMQETLIYDGIIPYRKKFTFQCHPIYEARFNRNDFITILDDSNNDRFIGFIKTKSRNSKGIYQFECEGMANEVYERTYDKSWATNTTKEKVQDMITSKLEFCTEGTLDAVAATDWSYEYNRACSYILYLNRFMDRQVVYILPGGAIYATDYDGLTATGKSWSLYDGNQEVWLIDIPELQDIVPGYYFGNTGITSVTVRYINNTVATRPATPVETFFKKRLKEFIDPKLQAATEVNQLGDNLYNIFSADTQFIGLRIEGEGWLQPGQTIQIQNTKQIAITQAHFLIIRIIYNPKDDVYPLMVLSDNIITPAEFISELKTNEMQIHTAIQQSCENQSEISLNQSEISLENYLEYDNDDLAAYDIVVGDLTVDGDWHELDLDSFKTVPSDAIGFFAKVTIQDAEGGDLYIRFRDTSQANSVQCPLIYSVGTVNTSQVVPVPLDSNHKFDYYVQAGMDIVSIVVLWWIREH